jgi:hypothetical protein
MPAKSGPSAGNTAGGSFGERQPFAEYDGATPSSPMRTVVLPQPLAFVMRSGHQSVVMLRLSVLVLAASLVACGPAAPNEYLAQACRGERPNWRSGFVTADTVLLTDYKTNVLALSPGGSPNAASEASGFCYGCARLLHRGFAAVDWLPGFANSADRVIRYSFEATGDARCVGRDYQSQADNAPPAGMCLAAVRDLPRSARYALDNTSTDYNGRGLSTSTYRLVDLQEHRVLAQGTEPTQVGIESPSYGCDDVGVHRDDAREFVDQTIRPARSSDGPR